MLKLVALFVFVLGAAASPAAAMVARDGVPVARLRLAPDRAGLIRIGMTAAQASDAVGGTVRLETSKYCNSFKLPGGNHGLDLIDTRKDGRLHLVFVYKRAVATRRGVRTGDSLAKLRRRYGDRLRRVRRGYDLSGFSRFYGVTKRRGARTYLLRFTLDDQDVIRYMLLGPRRLVNNFAECA